MEMIPDDFDMEHLSGVRDSKQLSEKKRNEWYSLASWLHKEKMACGIGACLGCVVETKSGNKLACKDGPVFNASELTLARRLHF